MDISIIIVNYNTVQLTKNCIDSIFVNENKDILEIIVVDNGSSDNSAELLHGWFPSLHIIRNSENLGFAKANNQGIAAASGNYILLLNSDTLFTGPVLSPIIEWMKNTAEVGVAGIRLFNADGTSQKSYGMFHSMFSSLIVLLPFQGLFPASLIQRLEGRIPKGQTKPLSVDYVSGAFLVVRSECFKSVGALDERFFMYSEEMELCYRITKAGWKVFLFPELSIVHLGSGSSKGQDEWRRKQISLSRNVFILKHHSKAYLRLNVALILSFLGLINIILKIINILLLGKVPYVAGKLGKYNTLLRIELQARRLPDTDTVMVQD